MSGAAHEKRLKLLDVELAIWRIPPGAIIPQSILQPKSPLPFLSITRLPTELSIIAPASLAPLEGAERGWRALVMPGPLDFSMVGVLENALAPLAAADIPVMAISTYETDCILVRQHDLERATAALTGAGYEFVE
jgi:hypothetical protein